MKALLVLFSTFDAHDIRKAEKESKNPNISTENKKALLEQERENERGKLTGQKSKQEFYDDIVVGGMVAARFTVPNGGDGKFYRAVVIDKFHDIARYNQKQRIETCYENEPARKAAKEKDFLQAKGKSGVPINQRQNYTSSSHLSNLNCNPYLYVWFIDFGNDQIIDSLDDILPLDLEMYRCEAQAVPLSWMTIRSTSSYITNSTHELLENKAFKNKSQIFRIIFWTILFFLHFRNCAT